MARDCLPCTACCGGWLKVDSGGIRSTLGSPCVHCTASGCGIYNTSQRPRDPCDTFLCGWRVDDSPLPDWMRPDQSKAIVLFNRLQWREQPATVAVAVGTDIPEQTLNWLKQHSQLNNRPLLWEEYEVVDGRLTGRKRVAAHGPSDFGREMMARHGRGELLW